MPTSKVNDGIQKFRNEIYPQHEELFNQLASGQQPEVLFITCSDSRIDPSLVTQTLPGDLFVIRNAGNLVGRYGTDGDAQAGTIEYAVKALGVKHIVVCGHSHCGAMAAVLQPDSLETLPAVAAWLKKAGPQPAPGDAPTLDAQVRFNVIQQLADLRTHPAVSEAEQAGKVQLHGWVYDFVSGTVVELQKASGNFVNLGPAANATVR